jgi:ABC-2 type transport system permease protein
MLWKAIVAESIKLKKSPLWLVFLLLPILPAFLGTFNYAQNIGILQNEWYSLWTQHTLFMCYFFLPALIGVYASYLFHLEHQQHNWNALIAIPMPRINIYIAKLLVCMVLIAITQIWVAALYIISGLLIGLPMSLPTELPWWILFGIIGGIVIAAIQLCISLVISSFAIPVGIAFVGGILGIPIISAGYGMLYPYTLISVGMSSNGSDGINMMTVGGFLIASCVYFVLSLIFAGSWLKLHDVVTD